MLRCTLFLWLTRTQAPLIVAEIDLLSVLLVALACSLLLTIHAPFEIGVASHDLPLLRPSCISTIFYIAIGVRFLRLALPLSIHLPEALLYLKTTSPLPNHRHRRPIPPEIGVPSHDCLIQVASHRRLHTRIATSPPSLARVVLGSFSRLRRS